MLRAVEETRRQVHRKSAIGTGQSGSDDIRPQAVGDDGNAVAPVDAHEKGDRCGRTLDLGYPPRQHRLDRIDMAAIALEDAVAVHHFNGPPNRSEAHVLRAARTPAARARMSASTASTRPGL